MEKRVADASAGVSPTSDLESARNLALQKIGRNLVNLQRMEAMLRHLLIVSRASGTPQEFERNMKVRAAWVKRLPMGHVVEEAAATIFSEHDLPLLDNEAAEVFVSIAFRIEGGKEAARAWRRQLMQVVQARNTLVHRLLESFDPSSVESCQALSATLDAQREQFIPVHSYLGQLIASVAELYAECARNPP